MAPWLRMVFYLGSKLVLIHWAWEIWRDSRRALRRIHPSRSPDSLPELTATGVVGSGDRIVSLRSRTWAWHIVDHTFGHDHIRFYDPHDPSVVIETSFEGDLGDLNSYLLSDLAGAASKRTWRRPSGGLASIWHYSLGPSLHLLCVRLEHGSPVRELHLHEPRPQHFPWDGLGWVTDEEIEEWLAATFEDVEARQAENAVQRGGRAV